MDALENYILQVAASGTLVERDAGHATLKAITAEIEGQLRRLRTLHNCLTPTGWLPSEVLSEIFRVLLNDERLSDQLNQLSAGSARALPRWISVTQVCAHWRHAALGCSGLWTRLDSRNTEEWVAETVMRAKSAPLRIDLKLDDCSSMFEYVLSVSNDRIRHLSISKTERSYLTTPTFEGCLSVIKAAPILETLDVSLPPTHIGETTPLPASVVLLLQNAPVLRELSLHYCTPVWDLPAFHGLTSLVVKDVSLTVRPSVDTLISTLKHMRNLAHLELTSTLPIDFFVIADSTPRVVLPHLKSLHIKEASAVTAANFLNRLAYPGLLYIEFECVMSESPSLSPRSAVPGFTAALRYLPFRSVRRLELKQTSRDTMALEVWDAPDREEDLRRSRGGTIALQLVPNLCAVESVCMKPVDAAMKVLKAFELADLENLSVSGADMLLSPQEWYEWFGHLKLLKKITMGNGCWSILGALAYASHPEQRVGGAWKLFPALRDIKFREMWITAIHFDHYLHLVGEFLKSRGDIRELELVDCLYLQEEDINGMKRFVENVIWKRPRWEDED